MLFIPLARFAAQYPDQFGYRALTRLGSMERPLPGSAWQLFLGNLWNAVKEFNWNNGIVWVHSIPLRPALDVASGALSWPAARCSCWAYCSCWRVTSARAIGPTWSSCSPSR